MRYHHPEKVKTLLDSFLRSQGLETPLLQYRIINSWPEVMGETIARYTGEVKISDDTLWVKITSPALRQNLMMMRGEITRKMNEHVGAQIIQKVNFF